MIYIIIGIAVLILIVLILYIISCNILLISRENFNIPEYPAWMDGLRIAHISDIHSKKWGRRNKKAAEKLFSQKPDIIVCTGDMCDRFSKNGNAFLEFLYSYRQIEISENEKIQNEGKQNSISWDCPNNSSYMPIFCCLGNHELDFREKDKENYDKFIKEIKSLNAVILDDDYVEISIIKEDEQKKNKKSNKNNSELNQKNNVLYLYGLTCRYFAGRNKKRPGYSSKLMTEIKPGNPNIVLCHDPRKPEIPEKWGAQCMLSGHMHGGSIRLPFIGGVLGPGFTLFPKYTAGFYKIGKMLMYVSRGMGYCFPDRILSFPQITILTIKSKDKE